MYLNVPSLIKTKSTDTKCTLVIWRKIKEQKEAIFKTCPEYRGKDKEIKVRKIMVNMGTKNENSF